ncbi:cytochrome P450 [Hypoxylon rubiginosum]|uniref:Cytochrome P450 n=1 Tax=Hypoxylon rubiginosum TaxID=110542 RepID=A0ACB9YN86_9PEZI|nr:cytochrome P450 [Hypoxylon rubiginosum]
MALSIYRLLFHSLRKYPGPVTARMSSLYAAFYAFRTDLHLKAWQNHANYGPVVRQGPNRLVFNSFNALRDIYQNERITKSRAYLVSQRAPGAYGLFNAIDRHLHQKKRKLLGPVVNDRSIRTFEPTMIDQIDIFIRQLLLSCQKEPLAPINMTKRFSYLTMDIMGYFVFGYPLDLQTEATNRFMIDATPNFFLNVALQLPVLGSIRLSNYRYLRVLLRGSKYRNTLRKMIRNRLAEGEDVKSSLLFMTDSLRVSENDDIFIEEIRSEATFLLSAGSDTMSTWLSALFFYLSRNQECYQRLTREIRGAFRCASEIQSGPRLANCYYLRSCLDETLRMSPPIPGTLWRKQVDDDNGQAEPLIIDGHHIPSGTEVGVNIYSLHHNEEYFPEPFTFRPERFLADGLEAGKVSKDGFAPFSLGARGCIGKSMAYQEASLIVAKTLWYFDFEKAQGSAGKLGEVRTKDAGSRQERAGEYQIYDVFGAAHDGPCLSFRPREDYVKELVEGVKRID